MTLAKYYIGFLENGKADLVDDLHDFHSDFVDPRELTVSVGFYHSLESEEALKKAPQVRHFLLTTQYTTEKVKAQGSGAAGVSQFLEPTQITAFCKKPDQVNQLEKTIRDLKSKYLPILDKHLGERQARLEFTVYMDLLIRCMFNKPWPLDLPIKLSLPVGKFSEEKVKALGVHWAKIMDLQHPTVGFAEAAGLKEEASEDPETKQGVDLENLRCLQKSISDGPEPDGPKFKRGDAVTVIRRMSWILPQKDNPKFRKDLVEGTEGIIEGWSDAEMRTVALKVSLKIGGKTASYTQSVYPRNLKLTSDYLLTQAGEGASKEPASGSKDSTNQSGKGLPKDLQWVVGSSDPVDVKVETKWSSLLADEDTLIKNMFVRSRIGCGLESLLEVLPAFTEKDFVLVHRKNEKGLAKHELHTRRDFDPYEIIFAPVSSQIKDSHLMAAAHAVVTLPKHGCGAHPENLSVALDGRGRNMIASKGLVDSEEHKGSLYWIVTRTSNPKEANLDLENCSWQQEIKVNLPIPAIKKRKIDPVSWSSHELPSFPVMVNKKGIKKHTKLCVFLSEKAKNKKE